MKQKTAATTPLLCVSVNRLYKVARLLLHQKRTQNSSTLGPEFPKKEVPGGPGGPGNPWGPCMDLPGGPCIFIHIILYPTGYKYNIQIIRKQRKRKKQNISVWKVHMQFLNTQSKYRYASVIIDNLPTEGGH